MSIEKLIAALQLILRLHKSLFQLAQQKTEVIKRNDIDGLNTLLKEELKHIQAVKKVEKDLLAAAGVFLNQEGQANEQPSLSACIRIAQGDDKNQLARMKTDLESEINRLKQQNELNQQLLKQSLQFVNMSLDLLSPKLDSFNYDRPNQNNDFEQANRSIFNSKA